MTPSSTQKGLLLVFCLFGALALFVVAPVSAAPCCSTCDQEDLDDPCWRWCLFSCYGDSSAEDQVASTEVGESSTCEALATPSSPARPDTTRAPESAESPASTPATSR